MARISKFLCHCVMLLLSFDGLIYYIIMAKTVLDAPTFDSFESLDEAKKAYNALANDYVHAKKDSIILNSVLDQRSSWGRMAGGYGEINTNTLNRDYDGQFGYPKAISKYEYQNMYDRNPFARRIVQLFPLECWTTHPEVQDNDAPSESPFVKAFEVLNRRHSFWATLRKADILSGVGAFGIIVFGLDDNKPLSAPLEGYDDPEYPKDHKLLYLRVFPHSMVDIQSKCMDRSSPRFGSPEMYQITNTPNRDMMEDMTVDMTSTSVHWTRVLHVADNKETSEIYGIPRMQLVYNTLLDITKVFGCAGEMFYKGAYPGYSITATDGQLPVQMDIENITQKMAAFENGFQRWIGLQNAQINALPSMYSEPSGLMEQYINAVAIALAVPRRIFEGSERGELASGQDAILWSNRLQERRANYLVPNLVRPFVNLLLRYGVIPEPFNRDYSIEWKPQQYASEQDGTAHAEAETTILQRYFDAGLDRIMRPQDYMIRYCGMTEGEADGYVNRARKHQQEEAVRTQQAGAPGGGEKGGDFEM
jgi:hypothetical protein